MIRELMRYVKEIKSINNDYHKELKERRRKYKKHKNKEDIKGSLNEMKKEIHIQDKINTKNI